MDIILLHYLEDLWKGHSVESENSNVLPSLENQLKSSLFIGITGEWLKTFELHHTQVKSCQREFKILYSLNSLQSFGPFLDQIEVSERKDKEGFLFTCFYRTLCTHNCIILNLKANSIFFIEVPKKHLQTVCHHFMSQASAG